MALALLMPMHFRLCLIGKKWTHSYTQICMLFKDFLYVTNSLSQIIWLSLTSLRLWIKKNQVIWLTHSTWYFQSWCQIKTVEKTQLNQCNFTFLDQTPSADAWIGFPESVWWQFFLLFLNTSIVAFRRFLDKN